MAEVERTVAEAAAEMKQEIEETLPKQVTRVDIFFDELKRMAPRYGGVVFADSPFDFGGTEARVTFFMIRFSDDEEDALLVVMLSRQTDEYLVLTDGDEDWPDEFDQLFLPILKAAREVEAEVGLPTSTTAN